MLRSCYSTQMRFYQDPSLLCDVSWFFVPDGTPFLPFRTPFNSTNWDGDPKADRQLGEVITSPRPYRKGQPLGDFAGPGPPCGTADQWLNGQLDPPATPTPVDAFGTPLCCPRKASPFLHYNCVNCANGAWDTYALQLAGLAGSADCVALNGSYAVAYSTACDWLSAQFSLPSHPTIHYQWRVTVRNDQSVQIRLFKLGTNLNVTWTSGPGWTCQSVLTITPGTSLMCDAAAAAVTVTPPA